MTPTTGVSIVVEVAIANVRPDYRHGPHHRYLFFNQPEIIITVSLGIQ